MCAFISAGSYSNLAATEALGICVIILTGYHIISEIFWLITTRIDFLKNVQNYIEIVLYLLTLCYVTIFCGCPYKWQWEIGIVVTLLAWINMMFHASNFPGTGLYVVMFKEIFMTFSRLVLFAALLVVAFALILYMMFYNPNSQVSPCYVSMLSSVVLYNYCMYSSV